MKATNTKPAPVALGSRVIVKNAATLDEEVVGIVESATGSGWFIVALDKPEQAPGCKDGKVSARISSLKVVPATSPAPASFAQQLIAATAEQAKPAKKGEDEDDEGEDDEDKVTSQMAKTLANARKHYKKDKRPDGTPTAHNGDAIAMELRDLDPLEVCALADKCLKLEEGFHATRYASLNPGQKRMNAGNRIRGAYKRAAEEDDKAMLLHLNKLLNMIEDEDEDDEEVEAE